MRIAGPTSVDLASFITTVDTECTKNPAGVIVVGGWDDALASEVDKCIDKKVPTVVTDGDLPMSNGSPISEPTGITLATSMVSTSVVITPMRA